MLEVIGLNKVVEGLKNLGKQVTFATAVALTRTAQSVQKDLVPYTATKFTIRGHWLRIGGAFGARIAPARKDRLEAKVFFPERTWWMKEHEKGGLRDPSGRNAARRGKRLAGFTIPLYATRGGTRVVTNYPGKKYTVWQHYRALHFARDGAESKLVAVTLSKVRIPATWGAEARGQETASLSYPSHFETEMQKAVASALLK